MVSGRIDHRGLATEKGLLRFAAKNVDVQPGAERREMEQTGLPANLRSVASAPDVRAPDGRKPGHSGVGRLDPASGGLRGDDEIGRASCRERLDIPHVAV